MEYQLRRYRVQSGRLDEFVELWRSGVLPLREEAGFELAGAWINVEGHEFVWIIGHEDFAAADAAYYSSPQRRELRPNPADLLESVDTLMLRSVGAE